MSAHPEAWKLEAACRGLTDLFFLERGDGTDGQEAKRLCTDCPVVSPCLEYAMRNGYSGERFGVWAGTSVRERRRIAFDRRHRLT